MIVKLTKLSLLILFFSICATNLQATVTIMPLGDSITEGYDTSFRLEDRNGYRRELFNLLTTAGYDVDFVGSLEYGTFSEKQHEGHGGWRDDQLAANVYNFLTKNPAQIVLLHIGTNALDESPYHVGFIFDEIDRWENNNDQTVIVILARIINRQYYSCGNNSTTSTYNNNIAAMAQNRTDDRIVIVDMECAAGMDYRHANLGGDMKDLLHPSSSGYSKMADKWFADGLLAILPHADAGTDQRVDEKKQVTLDASWSSDPDVPGDTPLRYSWEQASGVPVDLSDPIGLYPTFTAPAVGSGGERLEFVLTVTDTDGFQHGDTVFVDVDNVLVPPLAHAGSDIEVVSGRTVVLSGIQSHDPDGTLSGVQWRQLSGGNSVVLSAANTLTPQFAAPPVDAGGDVLTFSLQVTDNDGLTTSDRVIVSVALPQAPLAEAGSDQHVKAGQIVRLNGSESMDSDGTITVVQWEQVSGANQVTLSAPDAAVAEFTAPVINADGDILTFKLIVTDNDALSGEDIVRVVISPVIDSPANSNAGGSGSGCFIDAVAPWFDAPF